MEIIWQNPNKWDILVQLLNNLLYMEISKILQDFSGFVAVDLSVKIQTRNKKFIPRENEIAA